LDSNQSITEQYGISAIPTSFFIDKEGNIVSKTMGALNIDQIKEYFNLLLIGSAISLLLDLIPKLKYMYNVSIFTQNIL
jgi:thioredoxin-like negative regulator of GroEL